MKINNFLVIVIFFNLLISCADYNLKKSENIKEKKYYESSGFALIYDDKYYFNKIINKKIKNDKIVILHDFLRPNTLVKITNPNNNKFIETKVSKKANYPKIFNIVVSAKASSILELDPENPYIEVIEIKKNKKFIAKESNIFDEEKNVAEKAPVDEIKMDNLLKVEIKSETKSEAKRKNKFILVINDFYYHESANNLMNELINKTGNKNLFVKKINNTKYRLFAGPFKNFNALKTIYISLNNLGFENLNVYRE